MPPVTIAVGEDLERDLAPVAELLARGGVVAYPTDTLYGLAVDPRNPSAVARLFAVKRRAPGSAVPLIAADLNQVERAGVMDQIARRLGQRFWPGPLSLVIPSAPEVDEGIRQGTGTIAIRVPAHPVARTLAQLLGFPIAATSANISGEPPALVATEVAALLGDRIDLIVDSGRTPGGPPSTIVDVAGGEVRLIRAGAVPWERVLEFLKSACDV